MKLSKVWMSVALCSALALTACNQSSTTKAVQSSSEANVGCYSVDVFTSQTWTGGFNGAVRLTNNNSATNVTSFAASFTMGGKPTAAVWDGSITTASPYVATSPVYMPALTKNGSWMVGFTGTGAMGTPVVTALKVNGVAVALNAVCGAAAPAKDATYDTASGWAGQSGGTNGGSAGAVTYVTNATQLLAAVKVSGAKIIKVKGLIDMAAADNGGAFKSTDDQSARSTIKLNSTTTLLGVGSTAGIINGNISIKSADNVIVRNLTIRNPCDVAPVWDPNDGSTGNWNSQFDGIVVDKSTHVWIDQNHFTDAPVTDDTLPIANGKIKQCHDGALDIKKASDYVTVSNNVFELHEKNTLVGSSDSETGDEGHLTVTFNNNLYRNVASRAPRVRYGKVHIYNNYYTGDVNAKTYAVHYQIGMGYKAKIISANNVMDLVGATSCLDAAADYGSASGTMSDAGSLLNGAALNVSGSCKFKATSSWTVPYAYTLLPNYSVKAQVTTNAGVGKISIQ